MLGLQGQQEVGGCKVTRESGFENLERGEFIYSAMELCKGPWRDEQGSERIRVSKLQLHKGYMKLEPAVGGAELDLPAAKRFSAAVSSGPISHEKQQRQRKKWRFRVKPRVKVLFSTISKLLRRLRDSYVKVLLAMAAKARDTSLLTLRASLKKKPRAAIRNGSMFRYGSRSGDAGRELGVVEAKYLDYIRRSVTDGELAYYTTSLRNASIL